MRYRTSSGLRGISADDVSKLINWGTNVLKTVAPRIVTPPITVTTSAPRPVPTIPMEIPRQLPADYGTYTAPAESTFSKYLPYILAGAVLLLMNSGKGKA